MCFIWISKQVANISLYSMITNDAKCTRDIEGRTATATAAPNKMAACTSKLELNLRKKLVKV
jgi:hypothetical protein